MDKSAASHKYRPDIDGLRAVAVLSVVAYHAFPNSIKGGFIGVDVFFVISGFLISQIIFEGLERGTFSFAEFYARRIKRIFPALLLVLLACMVIGCFALLPDEYAQLGTHVAAGAGMIMNLALWREAGYFDNSGETKPLLHLWSLGVEEQFYILWPFLLWLLWKRKPLVLPLMLGFAAVSFFMNVSTVDTDPVAAFYSPLTRFWELICGGLLATAGRSNVTVRGRAADLLSVVGFSFLVYGFIVIDKGVGFPGAWAAVPVFGAVFMIGAGPDAWMNRVLLSNRLAVGIGLISYPLYLWHWPLLTYARIVQGEVPSAGVRLAAVGLAFVLSFLTYKLVERPIRFGKLTPLKVPALSASMILAACLGYWIFAENGWIGRFELLAPDHASRIGKVANAWMFRSYPYPANAFRDLDYQEGIRLGPRAEKNVLFIGDSHVEQYWHSASTAPTGGTGVIFTKMLFPPELPARIIADPSIKAVVFSYFWSLRYGSDKVDQAIRCCGAGKNGTLGSSPDPIFDAEKMREIDGQLNVLITALKRAGKEVYIVLDNPFGEEIDPHSMMERSWSGFKFNTPKALTRAAAVARAEPVRSRLKKLAEETSAKIIDPLEFLCTASECPAFSGSGEMIYKDYDHLSLFTSLNARYIDAIFK